MLKYLNPNNYVNLYTGKLVTCIFACTNGTMHKYIHKIKTHTRLLMQICIQFYVNKLSTFQQPAKQLTIQAESVKNYLCQKK